MILAWLGFPSFIGSDKKMTKRCGEALLQTHDEISIVTDRNELGFYSIGEDAILEILRRLPFFSSLALLKGVDKRMHAICHKAAVATYRGKGWIFPHMVTGKVTFPFEYCWERLFYPLLTKGGTECLNYLFGDFHFQQVGQTAGLVRYMDPPKIVGRNGPEFESIESLCVISYPFMGIQILTETISDYADMKVWQWVIERHCPYYPRGLAEYAAMSGNLTLLLWLEKNHKREISSKSIHDLLTETSADKGSKDDYFAKLHGLLDMGCPMEMSYFFSLCSKYGCHDPRISKIFYRIVRSTQDMSRCFSLANAHSRSRDAIDFHCFLLTHGKQYITKEIAASQIRELKYSHQIYSVANILAAYATIAYT